MKKILKIDKEQFIYWYFDSDSIDYIKEDTINNLLRKGYSHITMTSILNNIGYLPIRLIINKKDIKNEHICDYELFCPHKYKLKLIKRKVIK